LSLSKIQNKKMQDHKNKKIQNTEIQTKTYKKIKICYQETGAGRKTKKKHELYCEKIEKYF